MKRLFCWAVVAALGAGLSLSPTPAAGQTGAEGPRTPWGDPDLQGVWDYWTFTPLERPEEFEGRGELTDEEAAVVAQRGNAEALARDDDGPPPGEVGGYSQEVWTDRARATALTQSSLLVDPPDGRLPALTPEAEAAAEAHRAAGGYPVRVRVGGLNEDRPEARGVAERCLLGFSTGPPMLPGGYNNNVQIFQAPGYVVLLHEMVHDVRVVRLGGEALPADVRQWMGSSRGRWEGDTLVVETTNFTDGTGSFNTSFVSWGSAENTRLVERFTRVDGDTIRYEFTVDDPGTWTEPFTGTFPLNRSDAPLFEYACHEGNHGMFNLLSGARAEERAAAAEQQ